MKYISLFFSITGIVILVLTTIDVWSFKQRIFEKIKMHTNCSDFCVKVITFLIVVPLILAYLAIMAPANIREIVNLYNYVFGKGDEMPSYQPPPVPVPTAAPPSDPPPDKTPRGETKPRPEPGKTTVEATRSQSLEMRQPPAQHPNHVVRGIEIGMNCDKAEITLGDNYTHVMNGQRYRMIKREKSERQAKIEGIFTFAPNDTIRSNNPHVKTETILECTPNSDNSTLYYIYYMAPFKYDERPFISDLEKEIDSKYGPIRSRYQRPESHKAIVLGNFYNISGPISGSSEDCGPFFHNLPEGAVATRAANIDLALCSYAFYAIIYPATDEPDRAGAVRIYVWDYERFVTSLRRYQLQKETQRAKNPGKIPAFDKP